MDRAGTVNHPELGLVRYSVTPVSDHPDGQVEATIGLMRQYATEDATTAQVQRDAIQAVNASPGLSPAEAVFWWVKSNVRFVYDEHTTGMFQAQVTSPVVEALIRPVDMSALVRQGRAQGDCDDFAMYTASLLAAVNIPSSFVTVAADPGSSNFSHVYVAAYTDRGRVALDTSHGPAPGWEYDSANRVQEWPVNQHAPKLLTAFLIVLTLWHLFKNMADGKISLKRMESELCKFQ